MTLADQHSVLSTRSATRRLEQTTHRCESLHREAMSTPAHAAGLPHQRGTAFIENAPDRRRPRAQPASCGARHLIVTLAFTTSCCLSGVVFGWPALAVALKREGAYADKCADDDDECKSQEAALARVFTIGVLCMFGARLPVGLALDRLGARVTVVITLLGAAAECYCSPTTTTPWDLR